MKHDQKAGLDLLRQMMPFLAGRLPLSHFLPLAIALGAIDDLPPKVHQDLSTVILEENGNISAAARRLNLCPKTIYRRLKTSGLNLRSLRRQSIQVRHQPPQSP